MVSNGDVLIAPTARISAARAEALLQHEIGTHVVTYVNGAHQPLRVLASGLAGTEETQEGLAVFAEYLVGGLTANRLRQLAARVVAVHQMLDGAEFAEVHAGLVDVGVPKEQSFTITMRVFRSGGLTKDAVYLRGLHELRRPHRGRQADRDRCGSGRCRSTRCPSSTTSTSAGCCWTHSSCPGTSIIPAHDNFSRASPRSLRWPHSSEVHREDRFRHQRHRHREARVHDGAARARGRRARPRDVADGSGRLLAPRRRHRRGPRAARRRRARR